MVKQNKNQCQISKKSERLFKTREQANFFLQKTFSENFTAIHEIKPVLVLNKPNYVGFLLFLN